MSDKKCELTFLASSPDSRGYREIVHFESDTSFPPIHKGNLIDPRTWEGKSFGMYMKLYEYDDLLKANTVYHHIVQKKGW